MKTRSIPKLRFLILSSMVVAVIWMAAGVFAQSPTPTPDCAELLQYEKSRNDDLKIRIAYLERQVRDLLRWKLVRELESEVSSLRGLSIQRPIEMQVINREETAALIERLLQQDMPDSVAIPVQQALSILGALDPGTDVRNLLIELYAEQVGGLYDDTTAKLYVTDQFDPEGGVGKIILAHEICHALQDQNFDLSKYPLHIHDNDDRAFAALSVLEGDATVLMSEYMIRNLSFSWLLELPKLMSIDQGQFNQTPPFFQYTMLFPYLEGLNLIMEGQAISPDLREILLKYPPTTTEQVLHPQKYFRQGNDPTIVLSLVDLTPELDGDWSLVAENTFGEMGIRALLIPRNQPLRLRFFSTRPLSVDPAISRAAEGWGGDRMGIWMEPSTPAKPEEGVADADTAATSPTLSASPDAPAVVQWRTAWDTEKDAIEFFDYAAGTWLPRIVSGDRRSEQRPESNVFLQEGSDASWCLMQRDGNRVDLLIGRGDKTRTMLQSLETQ